MTIEKIPLDCPFIQLRFDDIMYSDISDWYCTLQDSVDNYTGESLETPCRHSGGYSSCKFYNENKKEVQE